MMRLDQWPEVLDAAVAEARAREFAWGEFDCGIWAFDTVAALTGARSHADAWRGRYHTELGSRRVMRRLGWRSPEDAVRALLGDPVQVPLAQRGDLVLAFDSLGICIGSAAQMIGEDGPEVLPLADVELAWKVGR